jgi:acyl-CoA reductase-like NAD-dependent aldehyde dehydrogenase
MAAAFRLLIDGRMVSGAAALDVVNPATAAVFERCARADAGQLDAAVAAAAKAFVPWSRVALGVRRRALEALAAALAARRDEFATCLTREQGKPLAAAAAETDEAVAILRAFAAMDLPDRVLRDDARDYIMQQRAPLGVVAAITPWNYPLVLLMMKVAPALLAGNTVVAKPAPTTPLTTLLFGGLCAPLLPPGVLNIIVDDNDLGDRLTSHPGIAKVAFTGSTATGRRVLAAAAASLARVSLELGGNDPAIVLDDVDVGAVASQVFAGAMANAGQVCFAIKRLYVPDAMYEPMCTALAERARALVVGDGLDPATQMGPLQNARQFAKVLDFIDDARARGRIIAGGHALDRPGYFVAPTIVSDLADEAPLVREEQFGPVLPVLRYGAIEDAIARANATRYGLGASVWARDAARGLAVAQRLEAGTVWVNKHLDFPADVAAGGTKQSGFGVKMGQAGLEEFTQPRIINLAKG